MANVYSSEVCLQTKNFPKIPSFFFKNTSKYDKLSKISNISIKTILELRTKFRNFGNFGNFGHISDGLRKQYSVRTQCCNLIGPEPLYIPCIERGKESMALFMRPIYVARHHDCGECTSARSQWEGCIQSKSTWLMFIYLFSLGR